MTDEAAAPDRPLLEPDRITVVDRAAPQHGGIDTHIDLVVLGCRAQDTQVPGEIPLR